MTEYSDETFYSIQRTEIEIRGRYLRFSAKLEGILAKIVILLIETKKQQSGIEETIDLKNFMFNQKLKKAKTLIGEQFIDLQSQYSKLFNHIDSFRETRNKMAHCYLSWDTSDLNSVIIWDLEVKNGIQSIEPNLYDLKKISEQLIDSMKNITNDLNNLVKEIEKRVKPIIPYMF